LVVEGDFLVGDGWFLVVYSDKRVGQRNNKKEGIVLLERRIAKHKKNASRKKNVGEGVLVAGNCLECILGAGARWVLTARVLVPDEASAGSC